MRTPRRNKLGALLLVLAVLFSALGWPVAASAGCAHGKAAVLSQPVEASRAGDHCQMMAEEAPCCCGHTAAVRKPASPAPTGERITAAACHCSIQAPSPPPPAAVKPARLLVVAPELACLPSSVLEVPLPVARTWVFAAPSLGPPRDPALRATPSRAPPACL